MTHLTYILSAYLLTGAGFSLLLLWTWMRHRVLSKRLSQLLEQENLKQ